MVSRRRILGRSQDNLNVDLPYMEDEDDVWYKTEKLLKDHIAEVLMKWEQIDDEIWAKVIVLESNRRVAKAYARVPVLTVNGSDDGFDGYRIGLCGFENPMRDPRTDDVKRHIGQGVKLKMDDQGNILIKRVSKAGVYVKITSDDNAISNEILKLPNCCLESERPVMLFDMNKFQQNVNREMRRQYPDRSKLELQCVCVIAFVKNESDLLDCPIWVMIINIVAMDMLKSKLPPAKVAPNIRNRPRIPIPDEDPYSVAGSGASSGSSAGKDRKDKPPKLPPRDNPHYPPGPVPRSNGKSDYDVLDENAFRKSNTRNNKSKDRKYDDPYYCGLRAHIPNFAKAKSKGKVEPARAPYLNAPPPPMWHTRSFDSGMGKAPSTPPPLPPTSSHPHYPLYAHHSNNSSNSHRRQQQQQTLTRHQQQQQHYHQLTHHHHHHPHHQYRHHAHAYSTMNLTMKSRSMSPPPGSPTEETYLALSAPPPPPHWIPQPSLPHHGVSSPQSLPLYIGSHPPLYSDDDDYMDREHDNDGDEEDAGNVGRKG